MTWLPDAIQNAWPLPTHLIIATRRRAIIDQTRAILTRRGGVAVILGRFTAFFRAVMPALSALSRMPYRRFLAFNIAGGAVWGAGTVLAGFRRARPPQRREKISDPPLH